MIGRGVSALVGLALPAVLAQLLDPASYGTYKQLFLIAQLALYSFQFGLAQSLFYFVPRTPSDHERRAFIGQTQWLLLGIGIIVGVLLYALAPSIAAHMNNPQLSAIALPLSVLAAALLASGHLEISLTARRRTPLSAAVMVGNDLLRVLAMLAAILAGYGVIGIAWGAALAAIVRWLASLAIAGGLRTGLPSPSRIAQQARYSLPFGAAVLLLQQQQQFHQTFVSTHVSPEIFALYAVGCMQIPVVSLLYTPMSETLQVRLAELESQGRLHEAPLVFSDVVRRLAQIFLPLCALMIATARPGIIVLYGPRYADAAGILRIAVLSALLASLPIDGVFKARARTGGLLVIYAAKLAMTFPMVALGHRLLGLEGVIAAHVLLEALTRGVQLFVVTRDLHASWTSLIDVRSLLNPLIRSVAGLAACASLVHWIVGESTDRWLNTIACAAAGLLMVAIALPAVLNRKAAPAPADAANARAA